MDSRTKLKVGLAGEFWMAFGDLYFSEKALDSVGTVGSVDIFADEVVFAGWVLLLLLLWAARYFALFSLLRVFGAVHLDRVFRLGHVYFDLFGVAG